MKKLFKSIPAALALVALASCSSDDLFNEQAVSQAVDGKTMEATIEGYEGFTRAAFAENKNDAGKADKRALVWTVGDSYKVYGELATADKYTLQNASAGKANGTFDLMTEDYNENPAFAVFPYDKIDADRASKKLTVTLSDWTYATAEVKDEGYNQGAFVSNVPMFGKIAAGDPKSAAFGYMTAILRVDLAKLPKRTTRLILVTDRPLTGTFETSFDPDGAYPEIVSPVGVDADKDHSTDVDKDGNPEDAYIMAIATDPVAQRTNKTFFIAVPTGNKYAKFDIYVEYNMGGSTQVELVGELGNTARIAAGKSVLNWQRGKVKSLTKEITVTASGNTPQEISQFLKDEWKSFPADAEINITVADGTGALAAIDLSTAAKNTFTVPAELKDRVVNIIVDGSIAEGYTGGTAMTIEDEDKAPVASDALRLINFCLPTAAGVSVAIDAPESQIAFTAPEGLTASYTNITSAKVSYGDMASEAGGLFVGEGTSFTGYIKLDDGSFVSEGTLYNIADNSNNEVLIKGNVNVINNNKDGNVTVKGKVDGAGAPVTTCGVITPKGKGDIYVENVVDVNIADGGVDQAGSITVKNVTGITGITQTTNADHAKAISISKVGANGMKLAYTGKGKVTVDDAVGVAGDSYIAVAQPLNEQDFTVTNLSGTFKEIKYTGTGAADIEGVAVAGVTISGDCPIGGGTVTLKNIYTPAAQTIAKSGTGALNIESCQLGIVTNAGGTISATGDAANFRKSIVALTQNGAGKIELEDMYDVTTLTLGASADVDYENTYIGTFAAAGYTTTATGTKASGIGTVTGPANFTPETDVWDGSVCPTQTTGAVYTSASLAALCKGTATTATLYLDLDMGGTLNFQDKVPNKGIANAVTTFNGNGYTISNLKAETGLFADRTAALTASNLTIDGVTLSATKNAGGFIGKAGAAVSLTSTTVKNITIASTSTGQGTDAYLGGMIGLVDAGTSATIAIQKGAVESANITGHYFMGGFIGGIKSAKKVYLVGLGTLDTDATKSFSGTDANGCTAKNLTFNPVSIDGVWSTLKSGTIAPFIGGIEGLGATTGDKLQIYGEFDSFDRSANKWNWNFLNDETIKFKGTTRDDINFIGYTKEDSYDFKYELKVISGFEANPKMNRRSTTATNAILDTDYNVYDVY